MSPDGEQRTVVRSRDGTEIAAFRLGEGPPLVLVHGTTADHTRWRAVLEPLAARFTVYGVDRRGRGASGDREPYAIEREFEDVVAVVDSIPEPVNLLGHSYGAICALEAALLTTNLRTLVLYEPPFPTTIQIYPEGTIERVEALLAAGQREAALETFLGEVVLMPEEQIQVLKAQPAWQARIAAAHTLPREERADMALVLDPERYRTIRVPTLLLLGGDSPPFLAEPTYVLEKALPDARVAVMPGQQHAAMDTGTQLFLTEIMSFLGP
jgi:pimeloyl-ACP methyl ester carboxylesterase